MSFTINDIYVYIFSWKYVTANAIELYTRVSPHFPNTYFINCDENATIKEISADRVIQLDDSYYYGGQFQTAMKHMPSGKILACIVGDAHPEANWEQLAINAVDAFNTENAGIYAPLTYYTHWVKRMEPINVDKQLYSVCNTDCTTWFISPKLTTKLKVLNYHILSNYGWGIDCIYCKEAAYMNLNIIRDYRLLVRQPKQTAYDIDLAGIQMEAILKEYEKL